VSSYAQGRRASSAAVLAGTARRSRMPAASPGRRFFQRGPGDSKGAGPVPNLSQGWNPVSPVIAVRASEPVRTLTAPFPHPGGAANPVSEPSLAQGARLPRPSAHPPRPCFWL